MLELSAFGLWAARKAAPLLMRLARACASAALGAQVAALPRICGLVVIAEADAGPYVVAGELHRFAEVYTASGATAGQALAALGLKVDSRAVAL